MLSFKFKGKWATTISIKLLQIVEGVTEVKSGSLFKPSSGSCPVC